MNNLTESEFQEIIHRRSNGVISFAEFLEELSARGINEYTIDVATGQATYKGIQSEFKTNSQINWVVANTFNSNKAIETIANISLHFLDFLKEIAEAGIAYYQVNILEKKVVYFGIGGEKVEEQLKI